MHSLLLIFVRHKGLPQESLDTSVNEKGDISESNLQGATAWPHEIPGKQIWRCAPVEICQFAKVKRLGHEMKEHFTYSCLNEALM